MGKKGNKEIVSAKDIAKKIGIKGSFGLTLLDIYRDGKLSNKKEG